MTPYFSRLTFPHWILNCSKDHSGPIRIDLFSGNKTLFAKLKSNGFIQERTPPLMSYRNRPLPVRTAEYIALSARHWVNVDPVFQLF